MEYTVKQLARLAGVSVRTLHYYDAIGLLLPSRVGNGGYRFYTEKEFLRLQQILFFRELDFDLGRIKRIFDSPRFDAAEVLEDQKGMLKLKRARLGKLIRLIDKTINNMNMKDDQQTKVTEEDLDKSFDDGKYQEYKQEAQERWGKDTVERSENIVKNMSKDQLARIKAEGEEISRALAENMEKGAGSPEVQKIIDRHFHHIIQFYDPTWPLLKIYRGLGDMYVEDERFAANYNKYHPLLANFMREAMGIYCDRQERRA